MTGRHALDREQPGADSSRRGLNAPSGIARPSSGTLSPWSKVVEIAIALAVFAVPSVFNPLTSTIFEADKVAVFRSLVILGGCFWAIDLTLNASPDGSRSVGAAARALPIRMVRNPVLTCAAIFLTTYIVSTMHSIDTNLSLWGSYDRAQGLITIAAYLGFFWIAFQYIKSPLQAERIVDCMILASVPVVLYAFAQLFGFDPIAWETDSRSSVLSTLGRSNFLGAYLGAVLPLTTWRVVEHPSRKRRLGLSVLLFAQLSILVASQARAALLGTTIGMVALVLIAATSFRSRSMITVGCVIVFVGAAVLVGLHIPNRAVAEEAVSPGADPVVASSTEAIASVRTRLIIWRATIDMILNRPLLGYGPDTFGVVFPRYSPPELVHYLGPSVVVDRAHNLLLDLGATVGVFGMASYLAMVIAFLVRALRATLKALGSTYGALLAAICASIVATTVQDQFSFWTVATASLFWLLIAVGTNLTDYLSKGNNCPRPSCMRTRNQDFVVSGPSTHSTRGTLLEVLLRRFVVPTVLCLGLIGILWMNFLPLVADAHYNNAIANIQAASFDDAIRSADRAIDLSPNRDRYHLLLGWLYLQYAKAEASPLAYLTLSEYEVQAAIQVTPLRFSNWLALGELYRFWATLDGQDMAARAGEAYAQAAQLSLANPSVLTEWGLLCHQESDFDEAIRKYETALAIDPNNGQIYEYLGDSLLAVGRYDDAEGAFSSAIALRPDSSHAQRSLADLQVRKGKKEDPMTK